ncbi:vWA domain-containing protein [Flindersiella endophytica]
MISPIDRWRLVLGQERDQLQPNVAPYGAALDALYGDGHGEGSLTLAPDGTGGGAGGGRHAPTTREWAEEIEALFGKRVREELLTRAAEAGQVEALALIDPEQVRPSVDLLRTVLSLAGSLPEAKLAALRRLADRIIEQLTRELANRMRPALGGMATPRPTRLPRGPLDLGRTLRANLHTARRDGDRWLVVPERPIFRTRARRSADWDVWVVVDVSASMERSVVYSALVASILHGVPALSVRLVTFSDDVVDLSELVPDPLSLLLEVSVGGGTDIGAGLRYVRDRLRVPTRTIVALVSDFDEGSSIGRLLAEVRLLAESGAHGIGLAALDDEGAPAYNKAVAERVAGAGLPVAALSPGELAGWIGERVRQGAR